MRASAILPSRYADLLDRVKVERAHQPRNGRDEDGRALVSHRRSKARRVK